MRVYLFLILSLSFFLWGCTSKPTPEPEFAKVVIEAIVDEETGEEIQDAIITVNYENEELEDLVIEEYNLDSLVIEVRLLEREAIYVNAPGYLEYGTGFRFSEPKLMMFPVALQKAPEESQG